jgi:hypothetical protein
MYEFVFHSHSMAPEPYTNDVATLRSKSAASFSGVRREVSSRFSSRCKPVSWISMAFSGCLATNESHNNESFCHQEWFVVKST